MANIGEKSAFHLGEIIPAFDQTTLVLPIKKKIYGNKHKTNEEWEEITRFAEKPLRLLFNHSIERSRQAKKKIEKPKNDVRNESNKPNPRKQRQEKDAKFKHPSISERRRIVGNIAIEEFQKEIDRNKKKKKKKRSDFFFTLIILLGRLEFAI